MISLIENITLNITLMEETQYFVLLCLLEEIITDYRTIKFYKFKEIIPSHTLQ